MLYWRFAMLPYLLACCLVLVIALALAEKPFACAVASLAGMYVLLCILTGCGLSVGLNVMADALEDVVRLAL